MTDSIYMWLNTSLWTVLVYLVGLATMYSTGCVLIRKSIPWSILPLSIAAIGSYILMQGQINAQGAIDDPIVAAVANVLPILLVAALMLVPLSLSSRNDKKE